MLGRILLPLLAVSALCAASLHGGESIDALRDQARQQLAAHNYRNAAGLFRTLCLSPDNTPEQAVKDMADAVECYQSLDEPDAIETLLQRMERERHDSWRVLAALAGNYIRLPQMVALENESYVRSNDWRKPLKDAGGRDRVKALQLMRRAESLLPGDADTRTRRMFYRAFAEALLHGRSDGLEWRLSALTSLDELPEPEEQGVRYSYGRRGAPVDDNGDPLFYGVPSGWDSAKNDGERWRWLLARLADGGGEGEALMAYASFLHRQFGVQTMADYLPARSDTEENGTGPLTVRTLKDNETIARLATGVKRFRMPDEHNFIRLFRRASDDAGCLSQANRALAEIYENRQQYAKAVEHWERVLPSAKESGGEAAQALLRITGKNGLLQPGRTAPAGQTSTLSYLFRNGSSVTLKAERLDERKLLADVRTALRANRQNQFNANPAMHRPEQIGRLVVEQNKDKYIIGTIAEWTVGLNPRSGYMSSRASIDLPFADAGCYLVTAAMKDGNVSRCVVWLADLALTSKIIPGSGIWFVADAVSGEPVPGATVTFFNYTMDYSGNRPRIDTFETADKTDENGLLIRPFEDNRFYQGTLTIAAAPDGRMAYQGFDHVWGEPVSPRQSEKTSAYIITDRPVYRPAQTMQYTAWFGHARYADNTAANWASAPIAIMIRNPRGETIATHNAAIDETGSVSGELALDGNAVLGIYSIEADGIPGMVSFRVEEYKRPEYEVSVATPDTAIALGDTATVIVSANYYYGAPVAGATVSYTITRTPHAMRAFPPCRWDWLYGAGAGWRSQESAGDMPEQAVPAIWPPISYGPPEVVAQGESILDADGKLRLTIDTLPARELFGNTDHQYAISVEVRDQSRRTIAGSGKIIATRAPFAIAVWADKGWYSAGEEMVFNALASLPSGAGLAATGEAVLSRLTVDANGAVVSEETARQFIGTGNDGKARGSFRPDRAGQYSLAITLTGRDGQSESVSGQTTITVRGGLNEGDFRYGALELVPDKREYAPGETVRLAVNSRHKNAAVILVARPDQGGEVSLVRLENGTALVGIPVTTEDQPNFYCDAMVVFDGGFHSELQQIFVPPVPKTLNVAIESDKRDYKPGENASFTVTVTDADGKPVKGRMAVAMYDRSVEYISGGSNVPPIQQFFWNWRRQYYPRTNSTLQRGGYVIHKEGDVMWQPIGVFGGEEADWNDGGVYGFGAVQPPRPMAAPGMRMKMQAGMSIASADMAAPMGAMPAPAAPNQMAIAGEPESAPSTGGMGEAFAGTAVRSDFADTALWIASLATDENGKAGFSLSMPEVLTDWKTRVWSIAPGTRVGEAEHTVATRKNIIVRPQAPRFLTQTDQVVLSANLHNYLPRAKNARAELVLEGGMLQPGDGVALIREFHLAANGEARADWLVNAVHPGEAVVIMKLLTDEESDAVEIRVPVIIHGARRIEQLGGVLRRNDAETIFTLLVPEKMLAGQSRLRLNFSGNIAVQLLDALPYLIEYPYGCTEQTLNRFLPVLAIRSYLDKSGLSLKDAAAEESLPADARTDEWKHRYGDPLRERARQAVFDDKELNTMVRQGVELLAGMQMSDGGWGWFSGYGERSYPHTTAVVVHGLLAARDLGAPLPAGMLERGLDWLRAHRQREVERLKKCVADSRDKDGKQHADDMDAFIHMILQRAGYANPDMRDFLHRDRGALSLTSLAMLGIALHEEGATRQLEIVLENLRQFLHGDPNGSAWLEKGGSSWWYWYNDAIELQAWYLMLLNRVDPRGDITAGVAKYLLDNRKNGSYWRSTRDTAYAIEALTRFAIASGESSPDMTVAIYYDGDKVMERRLTAKNLLANHEFSLDGIAVEPGRHELKIVRSGNGPVYFGGTLDVFSLEDPVHAAAGDLAVKRTYYKLHREDRDSSASGGSGQAQSVRTENYRREKLDDPFTNANAAVLQSGDLVEVELTIVSKNDYEYLVFEDMKAAGLEAVELRSGYSGNRLGAYVEYRDQKIALFVRWLPRGVHTISYRFRAGTPGRFSALPASGGGMYAPELAANSNEMKIAVEDAD